MKRKILKWIALIIIFVLVSFNFLKIVTYIMKPNSIDLRIIGGFYGEKKNSLDMVYIGGSASFVYYEPLKAFEDYGIASYNFGANTIQPELYKMMVKEIMKYQNPKLIVIDARAYQYREKDQPPTEVAYRNVLTGMPLSLNKIEFIKENINKNLNMDSTSYYFDIIKYHRNPERVELNDIKMAYNKYENPTKGFYFVPKVEALKKENFKTDTKKAIAKETEEILIDLLEYLKTIDTKVLFIVSPYIETKDHKESFNYISEKINEYGFEFLDANEYYDDINLDFKKDFYNFNHVNIFGAEKYTDFLSSYMIEKYNLPNHKEDKKYKSWYELLPSWNEQVNSAKKIIEGILNSK